MIIDHPRGLPTSRLGTLAGERCAPSLFGDIVLYMEHTDPAREAIAAEVRACLARANRPASWLADRAGISKTALSLKLKAQRSFTVEELLSVADALGIDADTLLPTEHEARACAERQLAEREERTR